MNRNPVYEAVRFVTALIVACCLLTGAAADDNVELTAMFGALPEMWNLRLSPDGKNISLLHMLDREAMAAVFIMSLDGGFKPVLAGQKDEFEIGWCQWANQERLLCGAWGVLRYRGARYARYPETLLMAVDGDGENRKVMMLDELARPENSPAAGAVAIPQFQNDIVDWLPDDSRHVLVKIPNRGGGAGEVRLDIYDGTTKIEKPPGENIRKWITDGNGNIRLRKFVDGNQSRWEYRKSEDNEWHLLRVATMDDPDNQFFPVGFGVNRDELLAIMPVNGRKALWSRDLSEDDDQFQIVYADQEVDLNNFLKFGKYRRPVAVTYSADRYRYHFFDSRVEQIIAALQSTFSDKSIAVVDESWDREVYLLHIADDTQPGRYYRFEPAKQSLSALPPVYPKLADHELAPMKPIIFAARDGADVPGILTLPTLPVPESGYPSVVLPYGGPQNRDALGYDWLVQFLAARGFAVLQINFRGSGGFDTDWAGKGGFKAWRQTIADISDGTRYLIDEGLSAPGRVCIAGWGYGGYAALMSVIEESQLYSCVVSIAGITDPKTALDNPRLSLSQKTISEYTGNGNDLLKQGSPLKRAEEITVPVLLFHGEEDINVTVKHSVQMGKRLKKAGRKTDLIIYKDAEHSIWNEKYRIDMLEKIGRFLQENTGEPSAAP